MCVDFHTYIVLDRSVLKVERDRRERLIGSSIEGRKIFAQRVSFDNFYTIRLEKLEFSILFTTRDRDREEVIEFIVRLRHDIRPRSTSR